MVEISNPAIVPGTSVGRFGADPLLDGHHRVTTWGVGACLSVSGAVVASREPSPGTSATFSGDSVGMQGERDVTWRALAGRRSPAPSSCSRAMRSSPTNSTARRRVGSRGVLQRGRLHWSGPDLTSPCYRISAGSRWQRNSARSQVHHHQIPNAVDGGRSPQSWPQAAASTRTQWPRPRRSQRVADTAKRDGPASQTSRVADRQKRPNGPPPPRGPKRATRRPISAGAVELRFHRPTRPAPGSGLLSAINPYIPWCP